MTVQEWIGNDNQLGIDAWNKKYKYENETFDEWIDRISNNNKELKKLILEKKFLFGGRILANRGLQHKGKKIVYQNCFVIPSPDDNIEGIYDSAKIMAKIFSMGGGVGISIDNLAPSGANINNAAKTTSGAVSFMATYDNVADTIGMRGRRAALIITINDTHPDLINFINIKTDLNNITKANISIKITDDFMNAVEQNLDWELHFKRHTGEKISKTVKAKDILELIAKNSWDNAEPAILNWNKIQNYNLLANNPYFVYGGVNPCLSGNMKILTKRGYKSFKEICNGFELNQKQIIDFICPDLKVRKGTIWYCGNKETIKIIFKNNKFIECTPNHVFKLEDGKQCEAKDLLNKKVKLYDKNEDNLVTNIENSIKQKVYDFNIPNCHWGIVENVVVHNCGELPLPSGYSKNNNYIWGGSCNLGAINLTEYVIDNTGCFDFESLARDTYVAFKAMNEVLFESIELLPYKELQDSVRDWRLNGLGHMGIASVLIKLGIIYGSEESIEFAKKIQKTILNACVSASCDDVEKYGTYKYYNKEYIENNEFFIKCIDNNIKEKVLEKGLSNGAFCTLAPTGTLALLFNISSSGEPYFKINYTRTTKSLDSKDTIYDIFVTEARNWLLENKGINNPTHKDIKLLPNYFISAQEINYMNRIKFQSALQEYIDGAISSTINLPKNATIEQITDIYYQAWKHGCKGVTVYRENCRRGGILNSIDKKNKTEEHQEQKEIQNNLRYDYIAPISKDNFGETYGTNIKKKVACGNLYINLCRDTEGNMLETFINTSKGGICQSNINAISRLISVCLRSGIKVEEIIDTISNIRCPACTALKAKGEKIEMSCPDAIAKYISDKYEQGDIIIKEQKNKTIRKKKSIAQDAQSENINIAKCPECGEALKFEAGCQSCSNCFYSVCS